ncbi:hypothetical protein ACVIGB_009598 [Bradyrhizobium sp. USDA 4341]
MRKAPRRARRRVEVAALPQAAGYIIKLSEDSQQQARWQFRLSI